MNCPVCKRELAPTLSICLTCGAMMNDTVREELETKIEKLPPLMPTAPKRIEFVEPPPSMPAAPIRIEFAEPPPLPPVAQPQPIVVKAEPPMRPKHITAELTKRDTSPTLVGFQPKNPTIPDWRLELQNSIRKRNGGVSANASIAAPATAPAGAATAQAAAVAVDTTPALKNEKVANALKRIEESRKNFSGASTLKAKAPVSPPRKPAIPNRSFPFDVVERSNALPKPAVPAPTASPAPKPQLVSSLRIEKKKFDTNKLPPIPEPEVPLVVETTPEEETIVREEQTVIRDQPQFERLSIKNEIVEIEEVETETEFEEIDDLAPLSMRFGAAVFDLIIGGFGAAILLSPFLISNADLATVSGSLAIGGAVLVVMFLYQTATMAFTGRTFGMKLFSIEIIDGEANELPTLHQSAVSSAVFLLSLLLGGIGFLPAFFNEERRTIHDMLSGTILIREY